MPIEVAQAAVKALSNPGDLILDAMWGSGDRSPLRELDIYPAKNNPGHADACWKSTNSNVDGLI
jgi:hypothetical protein